MSPVSVEKPSSTLPLTATSFKRHACLQTKPATQQEVAETSHCRVASRRSSDADSQNKGQLTVDTRAEEASSSSQQEEELQIFVKDIAGNSSVHLLNPFLMAIESLTQRNQP